MALCLFVACLASGREMIEKESLGGKIELLSLQEQLSLSVASTSSFVALQDEKHSGSAGKGKSCENSVLTSGSPDIYGLRLCAQHPHALAEGKQHLVLPDATCEGARKVLHTDHGLHVDVAAAGPANSKAQPCAVPGSLLHKILCEGACIQLQERMQAHMTGMPLACGLRTTSSGSRQPSLIPTFQALFVLSALHLSVAVTVQSHANMGIEQFHGVGHTACAVLALSRIHPLCRRAEHIGRQPKLL